MDFWNDALPIFHVARIESCFTYIKLFSSLFGCFSVHVALFFDTL